MLFRQMKLRVLFLLLCPMGLVTAQVEGGAIATGEDQSYGYVAG